MHLVAIFDRPLLSRTGHDTWPRKREAVHHHGAGQSYAMVDEIHGFKSVTRLANSGNRSSAEWTVSCVTGSTLTGCPASFLASLI